MAGSVEGFVAVNRFGLGARPGELAEAAVDPRGWLKAQISGPGDFPGQLAGLPQSNDIVAGLRELKAAGGGARPSRFANKNSDNPSQPTAALAATNPAQGGILDELARHGRELYEKEATARTLAQVESRQPLRERLVAFWSNHFTVSIARFLVLPIAGSFEREAIRPNVTGRFRDLLLAVVRHPGMLLYLDNARSVGPQSRYGHLSGHGLNENLARELLELHTLGVDGGYTQADVTSLARILTGWSIATLKDRDPGQFKFRPALHEPGEKILLGERFDTGGEEEGTEALAMLARHPSTAHHIARQFAVQFVADEPPAAVVERLALVYRQTDGDLLALTNAAIDSPEAWATPLSKLKTPNELVVSTLRAVGYGGDGKRLLGSLRGLGQLPFDAPSPAGWPDKADGWMGPSAILERADFASAVAKRIGGRIAPQELIAATIGPVADATLSQAVSRAASLDDANALILASPEFQRR
jgi:uncharacterized protein (DUF1800 family)